MRVTLSRQSGLSIKQQIKEQIRYLIDTGNLKPSEKIPSARSLADSLNVNRNTASLVYHELEQEGYLSCTPGRGTLIKNRVKPLENIDKVKDVVKNAVSSAKALGFSEEEFLKIASAETRYFSGDLTKAPRVLIVECNPYAAGLIEKSLKDKVGDLNIDKIILADLKNRKDIKTYLRSFKLVITEFSHLNDCKKVVNGYTEVMAVMISSRFKFLMELASLPKNTKVCHICYTEASIKDAARMLNIVENGQANFMKATLSTRDKLLSAIEKADVLMVSEFAYDEIKKIVGDKKRIIKFNMVVEDPGLQMIKEHLFKGE